jgi:hypothetical protein
MKVRVQSAVIYGKILSGCRHHIFLFEFLTAKLNFSYNVYLITTLKIGKKVRLDVRLIFCRVP